jgi:quinol monooxygenase YgiN
MNAQTPTASPNGNQLTLVAFLRAKPGQVEELGRRLQLLVEPTRAEAGCLNYDLHRSNPDADVWMLYENWKSPADLDAHFQTPYLKDFVGRIGEVLDGEMDMRYFSMTSLVAKPRA